MSYAIADENEYNSETPDTPETKFATSLILFFVAFWVLAGLAARLWSILCLFNNGTVQDKTLGIITSMLFGPFYWFYYAYIGNNYCSMNSKPTKK